MRLKPVSYRGAGDREFDRNTSENPIKRVGIDTFLARTTTMFISQVRAFFNAMEARSTIKGFRYKIFFGTPVEL